MTNCLVPHNCLPRLSPNFQPRMLKPLWRGEAPLLATQPEGTAASLHSHHSPWLLPQRPSPLPRCLQIPIPPNCSQKPEVPPLDLFPTRLVPHLLESPPLFPLPIFQGLPSLTGQVKAKWPSLTHALLPLKPLISHSTPSVGLLVTWPP